MIDRPLFDAARARANYPTALSAAFMATYGIREFKARASEILRNLADGEEVVITRRGKPCGKLIPPPGDAMPPQSLATLRGAFRDILPAATWEDFQEIKKIWEPRPLPEDDDAG